MVRNREIPSDGSFPVLLFLREYDFTDKGGTLMFTDLRIGEGFDVHKFAPERDLWLCGVKIPCEYGLLGHSDADVAVHALMDALLGAAALGDIGQHFPDTDAAYKGADSMKLLEHVLNLPEISAYKVMNCDITIIAQKPKLAPYRQAMRQRIAEVTGWDLDRVSVKFTTTEKLGFTGRGEGIAVTAVVLLGK
jgi:2-C-methyl-D-erythritol 2,4-cyclodiphosphate synthase